MTMASECGPGMNLKALQFLREFDTDTAVCFFCEGTKAQCKVNHCVLGTETPYQVCDGCLRTDKHSVPVQVRMLSR